MSQGGVGVRASSHNTGGPDVALPVAELGSARLGSSLDHA